MRTIHKGTVIALALVVTSCSNSENAKRRYLIKADEFAAKGASAEAVLNYQKAIQKDPQFGEAFYRLGAFHLKENRIGEAYRAFDSAIALMPENQDAKVKLADISLKLYLTDPRRPAALYDKVVELSTALSKKDPASFDAFRLKGYVAVIDHRDAEAVTYFQQANRIRPSDHEVGLALIQVLSVTDRVEESERVARALIESDRSYGPAYDVLYARYFKQNRLRESEKLLEDKIAANPKEPAYILELANHFDRSGNPAAAKATVDGLQARLKEFPNGRRLMAEFYVRRGNLDEALGQYRLGLDEHPQDGVSYRKRIASVLLNQGKKNEALQIIQQILKEKADDDETLLTRANLWIDTSDAVRVRDAVKDLDELSKRSPTFPGVRLALGRARLLLGETTLAKTDLLAATRERVSFVGAHLLLADLASRSNQGDESLSHANAVLALQPTNRQARLTRIATLMGMGKLSGAGAELDNYRKDYPQDRDGQLQYGLFLISQKKSDAAEAIFRALYRPGQSDLRPLEGLVDNYIASRRPERALALLQDELKASNGSPKIQSVLAATAASSGHNDLAIKQFEALRSANPGSVDILARLAQVYARNGQPDRAIAYLERALKIAPANAQLLAYLGGDLELAGRRDEAIAAYRQSLERHSGDPFVMNNLAMLLSEDPKRQDEALNLANQARSLVPAHPEIADTLGWIYLKKSMYDTALQIFGNLARKHPENASFRYHHGAALLAKGDKSGAKLELQQALAHNLPNTERQAAMELLRGI